MWVTSQSLVKAFQITSPLHFQLPLSVWGRTMCTEVLKNGFYKGPQCCCERGEKWTIKKQNKSRDLLLFENAAGFAISVAVQLHLRKQASLRTIFGSEQKVFYLSGRKPNAKLTQLYFPPSGQDNKHGAFDLGSSSGIAESSKRRKTRNKPARGEGVPSGYFCMSGVHQEKPESFQINMSKGVIKILTSVIA